MKSEGSIARFSGKMHLKGSILVARYSFTPTIINKILNYKETVQSIIVDDEISFSAFVRTCDCESSAFIS